MVEEQKITSWSNILSYELREHPVQPLGLLFLNVQLSLHAQVPAAAITSDHRVVGRHVHEPV